MPGIGHNDDGSATGGDPGQGTSSSTSETTAVVESTTTTNTSGAVTNRPPGANADANANGGARGGMGILSTVSRLMFMYWVMSSLMGWGKTAAPAVDPASGVALPPATSLWPQGTEYSMSMYVVPGTSTRQSAVWDLDPPAREKAKVWHQQGLKFDWNSAEDLSLSIDFPATDELMNKNGSAVIHTFLVKDGASLFPRESSYKATSVAHAAYPLVHYKSPPKIDRTKSLLGGADSEQEGEQEGEAAIAQLEADQAHEAAAALAEEEEGPDLRPWIAYWRPNITVNAVLDWSPYSRKNLPPQIASYFRFDKSGKYWPVVYPNRFWMMADSEMPINETTTTLPLHLSYSHLSGMKFMFYEQMEASFDMQESMYGGDDRDEIKRMFLETNPYLLGLTMVVSLFHSLFDFLAFKNDVSFWKNRKSMEGLSVRSIFLNLGIQTVVLLYLIDNDTSWMILISSGVGLVIECWKVSKAMIVSLDWSGRIPRLRMKDRDTYAKSRTKEHDEYAMKYLSYVLYPLAIGYSIYSLVYNKHKSWYSWILSSLVGAAYTFGFIMMTPQLWINYKLKSVAHLPWRTFMYKALNTFIDDLFAFIIKMPTMHRLACLRDDVIFLVYLYQRWIYPVDKSRTNEFGQGGDGAVDADGKPLPVTDGAEAEDKKDQ